MAKLKRCPFCGGEPECYRTVIETEKGYCDAVAVRCLACEARTSYILFDAREHPNGEEYEEAEKLWNRGAVAKID
jgi:Lar family restriction alleviation protein